MPDDITPFTEKELEALAREQGKLVRKGFENDVLKKVRFLQHDKEQKTVPASENGKLQELENAIDSDERDTPEQDLGM